MKQIKEYLESKKRAKKKKKEKKRKKSTKGSDSEDDSDEDLDSLLLKKLEKFNPEGLQKKGEEEARTSKQKSRSPTERRGRNSSRSPPRRRRSGSRTPPRRRRKRSKSPMRRERSRSRHQELFKRPARPLSAERAQKLAERTANAKWRDEQHGQRVNKYIEEAKKEEDELRNRSANDKSSSSFLCEHLRAAAGVGSVESRIKANKHNIQRGHTSMDKNFARR